jgi:hypothetical protein
MVDKGLALLLAQSFPDHSVTFGAPRNNVLENFICVHLSDGDNIHRNLGSIQTLLIVTQGVNIEELKAVLKAYCNVVSDNTYFQWTRYESSRSQPITKPGGQSLVGYMTEVSILCKDRS